MHATFSNHFKIQSILWITAEICTKGTYNLTPYVLGNPNETSETLSQNIRVTRIVEAKQTKQ